jgi:hypothetical protein
MATIPQQKQKTALDIEIKAVDMQEDDIVSIHPLIHPLIFPLGKI